MKIVTTYKPLPASEVPKLQITACLDNMKEKEKVTLATLFLILPSKHLHCNKNEQRVPG